MDGFLGSTQLPPIALHPLSGTHEEQLAPVQPGLHLHVPGAMHCPLTQPLSQTAKVMK